MSLTKPRCDTQVDLQRLHRRECLVSENTLLQTQTSVDEVLPRDFNLMMQYLIYIDRSGCLLVGSRDEAVAN